MGVWEAQRPQGRGLDGLGLAQGQLGTRQWTQHGLYLSQVGSKFAPSMAKVGPKMPSHQPNTRVVGNCHGLARWSQLGPDMGCKVLSLSVSPASAKFVVNFALWASHHCLAQEAAQGR